MQSSPFFIGNPSCQFVSVFLIMAYFESFAHAMEKGEIVVLLPYALTTLVQHGLQEKQPTDFLQ